MRSAKRIALISPVAATLFGGAVFGLVGVSPSTIGCGDEPVLGAAGRSSVVAEGRGSPAIVDDNIVVLEGKNRSTYIPPGSGKGQLRHVSSAPSQGTAYVSDQRGPDSVIVVRPQGVSEIPASAEVSHPAWSSSGDLVWAEDFRTLKVSSSDGRSSRTIMPPAGSTAIFSPLFTRPNELVAVVQERVEGDTGEDDSLSNLWRYDLGTGIWSRLTGFQATSERWSVLRTPVVSDDGSIFFVRLQGIASETKPPSFELWSLRSGAAAKVRDLPKEMYLAGISSDGLLWNIYDGAEWRLFLEGGAGMMDLGCGAAMVDPRAQPDPDIPRENAAVERPTTLEGAAPTAVLAGAEMAILVGDFSSRQRAEAVAGRLRTPGLKIVNHRSAPLAIAPGSWGVASQLAADADLTAALDAFRGRFPEYEERSWIVSLTGGSLTR